MVALVNAICGQDKPSLKSISGYCFKLVVRLFNLRSKQQIIVAQSSSEAEFIALAYCVCEVLWVKKFKCILTLVSPHDKVDQTFNMFIGEENLACIKDAYNPEVLVLYKHVDIE